MGARTTPDRGVWQNTHQVGQGLGEVVLRVDRGVGARSVLEEMGDAELVQTLIEVKIHLLYPRLERVGPSPVCPARLAVPGEEQHPGVPEQRREVDRVVRPPPRLLGGAGSPDRRIARRRSLEL